jgi:methanogenic corrinoid protein MtbC1
MTAMTGTSKTSLSDHALREPDVTKLSRSALARLCAEMQSKGASGSAQAVLGNPCIAAMAHALCDADDAAASGLVDELLQAGLSVEEVCLDHLAPAARRLGDLWSSDRLPFTEVALASARIQAMLRRMPSGRMTPSCGSGKGAVFAAVPGEQHTLGVMMAADLFRRNGWDVGLLIGLSHDELIGRIGRDDRPVVGLSCSGDHSYPALRRLLGALAGVRPDARILLSGQIVGDADKIKDLPAPVTIVADVAAAEAEMIRIEASFGAIGGTARPDQSRRRASSAA